MAKKTDVAKRQAMEIGGMSAGDFLEQAAGAGNEEVTQNEMALPFISLLQSNSPQVNKRDEKYVEGAEPGMFLDTVRGTLWDGEEGMMVIPIHLKPVVIEWRKRSEGGGFIAVHPAGTGMDACEDPEKHDMVDTHQHAVMVRQPDGEWAEAIWPMKSTALTPSRRWNTLIKEVKLEIYDEEVEETRVLPNPPRWAAIWKIRSTEKTNEHGTFFVPTVPEHQVNLLDLEPAEASHLMARANEFCKVCQAGQAQIDYSRLEDAEEEIEDDPDAPDF